MSPCTSPWLSERLISRLSPLRRANLERRITEHLEDVVERQRKDFEPLRDHEVRLERILGRAMMLISNAELRERSERHG